MEGRETSRSFLGSCLSGLGWWDSISPPLHGALATGRRRHLNTEAAHREAPAAGPGARRAPLS